MTPTGMCAAKESLPQIGGRLLWSYRVAWIGLAIVGLVASALAAFQQADPALLVLKLVKSAVLISVATILLRRRQRDPVAALLALAFLTWTTTSSFDFGTNVQFAQVLDRCRFLLFALALLLFPDGRWEPGWTRTVGIASAVIFTLGVLETLHIVQTRIFLPLAIICVLAAIGSLVVRFRSSADYALKQQLKWVALALIAGVGLILCARAGSALSSMSGTPILWEALFQLGIIIVALGFLVALLRYRLFDAETVITRSAAYATLTITLIATFGGTEAVIQNLGQLYLGMNVGSVSGGMAAAVAAVLLQPLHHRISAWAEHRFQPDLTQLKREMPELLAHLTANSSPQIVGATVLPRFNAAIHASHSAMVLDDQVISSCGIPLGAVRQWWRKTRRFGSPRSDGHSSDQLFPVRLRLNDAPITGTILVLFGPRPDGTLYSHEDLDAVRSTFPGLRRTLASVLLREAFEAAADRREKHIRDELRDIGARLRNLEIAQFRAL